MTGAAVLVVIALSAVLSAAAVARRRRAGAPSHARRTRPQHGEAQAPGDEPSRPVRVSVRALRADGLAPWPEAVGVWLPDPLPTGSLVCRGCVDDIGAWQDDADHALVLVGEGARHRVARRCAVHVTRR